MPRPLRARGLEQFAAALAAAPSLPAVPGVRSAQAEAALTPAARDFISRLLSDVEERLGRQAGSGRE